MMRFAKEFGIVAIAHLIAFAVFLGVLELFKFVNPGKEAWQILLLTLALAFVAEVLWLNAIVHTIHDVLKVDFLTSSVRHAVAVVVSWVAGGIIFGLLDSVLGKRAPLAAFALSILTLFLFVSYYARIPRQVDT